MGGDGDRGGGQPPQRLGGVVAPQARPALAVLDEDRRLVEGRVRARRGIDDRVGALLLDLAVCPVGHLPAAVLEQRHLARALGERLGGGLGVEGDLHPLPVALVHVVELVEVPVEPVLDDEPGLALLASDVRIGRRRGPAPLLQPREVGGIGAAGVQGRAGQVEEVVVPEPRDLRRRGRRLDDRRRRAVLVALQLHPGIAQHHLDRLGLVLLLLLVADPVLLRAQHLDRGVGADQPLGLGARGCGGRRRRDDGQQDRRAQQRGERTGDRPGWLRCAPHGRGFFQSVPRPRSFERPQSREPG